MLTPIELRQKRAKLLEEAKAIVVKAEGEERNLSEEELREFNGLMDQADDLLKRAERIETLNGQTRIAPVEPIRPDPGSDPDPDPEKRFASFGMQLQAVARAANGEVDQRLLDLRAVSGLNEGVPSEGGFLVQTDFATELVKVMHETGLLIPKCRGLTISTAANGIKINAIDETDRAHGSRWGGILAYWAAAAGSKTKSKPKFRQIEVDLKKLIGLCYATDEMLQDAVALESIIREGFAEEFGFMVDDGIIEGTGAGTLLGILNSPCLVNQAKETGQAAATIVAENVEKMYARMPARSMGNAVWCINQECWPQLFQLHHAIGTGGVPVFVPAGGLSAQPFGTLLNRPILPIEQASALGTKGDIIFADFSQYLLADKGGMQSASSIHVRFVYDETVFRFVYRTDGQPIPNAAMTPFKGTATQSPFITLATRA